MRKDTALLLLGYFICSVILTLGLYIALALVFVFAAIANADSPSGLIYFIFIAPQAILIPLFLYLYKRDRAMPDSGKIKSDPIGEFFTRIVLFCLLIILAAIFIKFYYR